MYRRKLLESGSIKSEMITLITRSLYERDKSEQEHSERVEELCRQTAEAINLESHLVGEIVLLGMLHDIGKIGLNQNMLKNNMVLDEEEWKDVEKHPETGYHILKSVSEFSHIAEYVLCHHERIDGEGYPRRLKGDDIPIQSRILAVAESYDSMVHKHYKEPISVQAAINELLANSGTQFDNEIVKVFIEKVIRYQ
jgi:HD-GYP domain-containing protein (c-di-GMP phosphodiesterase class II)